MNKLLYVFIVSLCSFFQAYGMNKDIVVGAQYYAVFDGETKQIKFRKAVGETIIPFNEYRGDTPQVVGDSSLIGFFNEDGNLIRSEPSEKIEHANYTTILTAAMLKLDSKVKKPIATSAQLFECEDPNHDHGREKCALKLFDKQRHVLGCFTYNDHVDPQGLAEDPRISKYIDVSQLKANAIEIHYTDINDCGVRENCTIL